MPKKQKTHKATAKRIKRMKSGKLLRLRAGGRHLLSHKSRRVKRRAKKMEEVSSGDAKRVRKLIGGGI